METVEFSKIVEEDLDVGDGLRQIRLQDASLVQAHRISIQSLFLRKTVSLTATAAASVLTWTGGIPANARVAGVTTKILTGLGTTQSLTGFAIGDPVIDNRWGTQTTLTINAETDQGDFGDQGWQVYTTATNILLTALGGTFDGTGVIEVTLHYFFLTHRSA